MILGDLTMLLAQLREIEPPALPTTSPPHLRLTWIKIMKLSALQVLASLQTILGVSLPGAEGGPRPGALPCTQVCVANGIILYPTYHITFQAAALAGDLEPADLVGAVLGEVLLGLPTLQEQVSLQNLTPACYQVLRCSTLSAAIGVKDKRSTLVARELPSLLSPLFSQVFGSNLSPF